MVNRFLDGVEWFRIASSMDLPTCISEGYYFDCLLQAIGQMIGPIVKLDAYIDEGQRGRFARLVVTIDLQRLLVSKL